jgi:hypothetical protein
LKHGDNTHDCASEDASRCQYTQTNEEKTFPKIESLTKTDTTLVMTGENFYTVGYTVTASYKNIAASSVVVNSETEAVATFEGGVPIWSVID